MERMTYRDTKGEAWYSGNHTGADFLHRLTEYEDTGLTPAEIIRAKSLLDKYTAAIKEGSILVLPCAIGAPVYMHSPLCWENGKATFKGCKFAQDCTHWRGFKCPLKVVEGTFNVTMYKRVGKTFWLTPEEAEAAIPADQKYRP